MNEPDEQSHLGVLGRAMVRAETRERSRAEGERHHLTGGAAREFELPVPVLGTLGGSLRGRLALALLVVIATLVLAAFAWNGAVVGGIWAAFAILVVGLSAASAGADSLPASMTGILVGADGVSLRGRFIAHSRVQHVRHEVRRRQPGFTYGDASEGPADEWVVMLELGGGETVELSARWVGSDMPDEWGADLAGEIEGARAAWIAAQRGPDTEEDVVARGARTGPEWLHDLRRLAITTTGPYRTTAMDAEQLSRLLDDSRARPSVRAAAAIVLSASGDSTTSARLRVAAGAVANPRLRIALENVAHAEDDAAVAEALETLDREERAS